MSVIQLCVVCVLTIRQLMVYTGFSNASVPSACHSLATCLPLNIWKSAPFERANQHFWNTHRQTQTHANTHTHPTFQPYRDAHSHAHQHYTQHATHGHTHSESHIAMAWNAFYADWVQALSWSESSLEFDMRLKGAMSFQLGKSPCQPTQLPLQPVLGKSNWLSFCLRVLLTPHVCEFLQFHPCA